MRECRTCLLALDDEMFRKVKGEGKRNTQCKTCQSAQQKEYRERNRDKIQKQKAEYSAANREAIRVASREYYHANKESCTASRKAYYLRTHEHQLESRRKWSAANSEKRSAAYFAERAETAAERAIAKSIRRARTKANRSIYNAMWRANNRDKVNDKSKKRHRAEAQATPLWANKDAISKFYETAHQVSMVVGEWYHVDHIVPIQSDTVCGLHCEFNLNVLAAKENQSKGNRHWPEMWEPLTISKEV